MRPQDRVAIVVYAGAAGVVLPSTPGDQKARIQEALDQLRAGGSTAGAAGIQLAYNVASENFIAGGNNRIILATDGDFNIGVSSDRALKQLISRYRNRNIFLSVLGFGTGNYQDAKMQVLAGKGNGNAAYIDSLHEARKVLVQEMGGTLLTIAKDAKIQIEFNPKYVQSYRLIGYDNRRLAAVDFNNDRKDAGEIGAGHTVVAFYEIIPRTTARTTNREDATSERPPVDALKYQQSTATGAGDQELATVKLRYKTPEGQKSRLLTSPVDATQTPLANTSDRFRFAAAVAEAGLRLRQSAHGGNASYAGARKRAMAALGADPGNHRRGFIRLLERIETLERPADFAGQ